jgi:hypothetical protein
MDEAGTIEIKLGARKTESALRMGHDDLAAWRYTIISIVDTGRGMDEATREESSSLSSPRDAEETGSVRPRYARSSGSTAER